jgi:hypothetical protein
MKLYIKDDLIITIHIYFRTIYHFNNLSKKYVVFGKILGDQAIYRKGEKLVGTETELVLESSTTGHY